MELQDPRLVFFNWIMEDDITPDPCVEMLLADDDKQADDDAEDFDLISFLLQQERAGAPTNLFPNWNNLFAEVDILDEYGNRRQQHPKKPRGKQRTRDPDNSRFQKYLDVGENTQIYE